SNPVSWSYCETSHLQYLGPYGISDSISWGHRTRVLVGGPGFEPGASRSRTVSLACPPVSEQTPESSSRIRNRPGWCPLVTPRTLPIPGDCDPAVTRRGADQTD